MDALSLIFFCFVMISFVGIGNGKYVTGMLKTSSDWEFLTRFCFLSQKGTLDFFFEYPTHYGPQNILLYFDEPGQWQSVYRSSKSCTEKEAVLNPQNNQIIYLTNTYGLSGCTIKAINGVDHYSCTGGRTFRSARERWWFVAVSKCVTPTNRTGGMSLKYEVSMTNGPDGDYLHKEYSADEFYITPILISFLLTYVILLVLSVICAVILRNRQLWHSTYKLFMVSVACWTVYLFFMTVGYGTYGNDGNYDKLKNFKTTGRVFEALGLVTFLLMLILIGKGYTITRGRLSTSGTIKLSVFFTLYIITYAVLIIWEPNFFDPGLVLYIYESPPGYGLICMRLIGWVWLCYSVFFTLKHYSEKKMFYIPFFIFYTFWFWAGPVVILIAMLAMAQWTREKTVVGVESFVALCGHLFFLTLIYQSINHAWQNWVYAVHNWMYYTKILTRPSAANKNFPYHVRTTQIGIMLNAPHQMGTLLGTSAELNSFGNHAYSPRTGPGVSESGPDFTGLFVTSKQRSNFPQNEPEMSLNNNKSEPEDETSQLPRYSSVRMSPSAPPRFWAGPVVILIAMLAMAQWTREKTVVGVESFVALCGHLFFLTLIYQSINHAWQNWVYAVHNWMYYTKILTRPSAANKNFPYHVRTTQIGIMLNAPHQMGTLLGTSAELNSFGNHAYSPRTGPGVSESGPDFTGLFVTSKQRSNFPQNEPEMSLNNNKSEPEDETSQLPRYSSVRMSPSAPPRYETLFTVADE